MEIINYFESGQQALLIQKIAQCDWSAARFLVKMLQNNTFNETLGGWGHLFVLMDGDDLISFATLTGQDSVRDDKLTPWIGFVFTQPHYRGHRYAERVLAYAEKRASELGYRKVFLGTDHIGLYEKYGYTYLENRNDCWGDDTRVMFKEL